MIKHYVLVSYFVHGHYIKNAHVQNNLLKRNVLSYKILYKISDIIRNVFVIQPGSEEEEVFWPQICIVVNDNPEGQLLAGIFNSALANFPCRICWWCTFLLLRIVI